MGLGSRLSLGSEGLVHIPELHTDKLLIITSTGDVLFSGMNIDDFE